MTARATDPPQPLYEQCREQGAREASPTAAITTQESEKRGKRGLHDRKGTMRARRSRARRGHLVDTFRLDAPRRRLIQPTVKIAMEAFGQGRPGSGVPLLEALFADGGYQGTHFAKDACQSVPHLDGRNSQTLRSGQRICGLPKRWIRRAFIAGLNRCRRLARLGEPQPKGTRVLAPRFNSASCLENLPSGLNFRKDSN